MKLKDLIIELIWIGLNIYIFTCVGIRLYTDFINGWTSLLGTIVTALIFFSLFCFVAKYEIEKFKNIKKASSIIKDVKE